MQSRSRHRANASSCCGETWACAVHLKSDDDSSYWLASSSAQSCIASWREAGSVGAGRNVGTMVRGLSTFVRWIDRCVEEYQQVQSAVAAAKISANGNYYGRACSGSPRRATSRWPSGALACTTLRERRRATGGSRSRRIDGLVRRGSLDATNSASVERVR